MKPISLGQRPAPSLLPDDPIMKSGLRTTDYYTISLTSVDISISAWSLKLLKVDLN